MRRLRVFTSLGYFPSASFDLVYPPPPDSEEAKAASERVAHALESSGRTLGDGVIITTDVAGGLHVHGRRGTS